MSSSPKPVALPPPLDAAAEQVTALYQANALGLVRLAYVLIGDPGQAEDIVQDAFCGLYRRWEHFSTQPGPCPTPGPPY
jgi:DNA-directed RNA polymerase specialized sigma24 family protein